MNPLLEPDYSGEKKAPTNPLLAALKWKEFKAGLQALLDDPRRAGELGMVKSAVSGATLPGDVYAGQEQGMRVADMAGLAMTGGVAGTGQGGVALGSGPIPRHMHGTTVDNVPSIRQIGIVPGASKYTRNFYGEDIPEALFLASEHDPKRAFSSIRGQIADKLGKHPSDVTAKEIKEHGALILAREDPYDVYQYADSGHAKNRKGGYTDEIPPQAEPGDYFSTSDVAPTGILKGERLARYLEKQGLLDGVPIGAGANPTAGVLNLGLLSDDFIGPMPDLVARVRAEAKNAKPPKEPVKQRPVPAILGIRG
jgi:hypothetical protein